MVKKQITKQEKIVLYTKEDVIRMHNSVKEKYGFTIESVINNYDKINSKLVKLDCATFKKLTL